MFRALGHPARREILDRLHERDGQSLGELERAFEMTRFGVMKHLRVLEEAGLVVSRKAGRERLHYLNPVPIRELHDRWIGKFAAEASSALLALRAGLERGSRIMESKPSHLFLVYIRTTPERVWEGITNSEFTTQYYYSSTVFIPLRMNGQPSRTVRYVAVSPSNPSWSTVSLVTPGPAGSISQVSLVGASPASSSLHLAAKVVTSLRGGSDSMTSPRIWGSSPIL